MLHPLIRAQVLENVLRGYLQTRGAFFTLADVKLCAANLERSCTVQGPYPPDFAGRSGPYNALPEGY